MLAPNSRKSVNYTDTRPDRSGQTLPFSPGNSQPESFVSSHKSSDACIVGSDLNGTIVSWNVAAERLFGYTARDVLGKNISLLAPSEETCECSFSKIEQFDAKRVTKSGTFIDVSIVLTPIEDPAGNVSGFSTSYFQKGMGVAVAKQTSSSRSKTSATEAAASGAGRRKVMLATAGAGGTVAAVRVLNKHGFDVGVISSQRLGTANWSKAASRKYRAPLESNGEQFLAWLMETGAAEPGQVLLPTSDQTSWLYTVHAKTLAKHFRVYQPSVETMSCILDKKMFSDAAVRAGLSILPSWEPKTMDELQALAPRLPYPILIKPRTHVHRLRNDKGLVVQNKTEMIEQYGQYVNQESVRAADNPLLPDAGLPILQQFVDVSKEGVYSVSGFIDRTGEHFVTRRSVKVFQRSQPVGVGICFESRPTIPALSNGVKRLCKELNYFGMFEVEFIRFGDTWAAIDFNPRMFNQVGLDVLRGMPLPLLACLDALEDHEALREAVATAQSPDVDVEAVFCDRFTFRSILMAKTLTGRISRNERAFWKNWLKQHASHAADFAIDPADPLPGPIHALSEIYLGLKAFPKFLRLTPKTSPELQPSFTKVRS